MKEYKCAIVLSSCEGDTVSPMITLNDNDLDILNKIAAVLPYNITDYAAIQFCVVRLPDHIPNDIETWYHDTPGDNINWIIASGNPSHYNNFKLKEKIMKQFS